MMKNQTLVLLAVACMGLAGCQNAVEKTMRVQIAPAIKTRVTGVHFDLGDRIGLTIERENGDVYADNVMMTYDGTAFFGSELVWYNNLHQKSTLRAFYPYFENGEPTEFAVAADQSRGYADSDLLAAVKSDVTPSASAVGMLFRHLLSQLTIIVANNSSSAVADVAVGGLAAVATVDIGALSATAKSGSPAVAIKAFEVSPDLSYRAILIPQQAPLTVTVFTADGQSRSKTIPAALLEGGKRYDLSVTVTNIDIEIVLSGDIEDWEDGGSLDDGQPSDGDPTLTYQGATYRTQMVGGKRWMAENMRYVPDNTLLNKGVWYPSQGGIPGQSDAYVRERGMLYSYAVACGDGAAHNSFVQGICPLGWHVPDADELQLLVSEQYDYAAFVSRAGFWNSATGQYGADTRGYLMSCVPSGDQTKVSLLNISEGFSPAMVSLPIGYGVSLRCVKDAL